jgi:hypothetical protein
MSAPRTDLAAALRSCPAARIPRPTVGVADDDDDDDGEDG